MKDVNKALEYRVLGCCLSRGSKAWAIVCGSVTPLHFGTEAGRAVMSLLGVLDANGKAIGNDLATPLYDVAKNTVDRWNRCPLPADTSALDGVLENGAVILEMVENPGLIGMLDADCVELRHLFSKREARKAIERSYAALSHPETNPLSELESLADSSDVGVGAEDGWVTLADIEDPGEDVPVALWGMSERGVGQSLDRVYPLCGGRYSVLTGKPGAGKSSLAIQLMAANAAAGRKVAFVSLEMCKADVYRFFRNHGLCQDHSRNVRVLDPQQVTHESYAGILKSAFRWGASLLVVDHIGLTSTIGQQKEHEAIGQAAKAILAATKRQDQCHVMVLAQMTKEGRRQIKKDNETFDVPPTLDDIEGGKAVTDGTAFSIGLWRPKTATIEVAQGEEAVRMSVLKARFTGRTPVELRFHGASHTFTRDRLVVDAAPLREDRLTQTPSEDEDLFA